MKFEKWRFAEKSNGTFHIYDENGLLTVIGKLFIRLFGRKKAQAKAKLIAAAPELLKALEDSLQILEQTLNYRNANKITVGNIFLETAIDSSKKAIKKATS